MGGADGSVPAYVDKSGLLGRWGAAMEGSGAELHADSRVIAHGCHDLAGEDRGSRWARLVEFREVVGRYLDSVVGGVDRGAWGVVREAREGLEREGKGKEAGDVEVEAKVGDLKL